MGKLASLGKNHITIKQKYKLNELLIWEQIKSQNAPQRHTFCPYADEQSKPVSQLYRSTYVSVAQSPGRQLERRSGLHSWGLYLHNILTNEPAGDDPWNVLFLSSPSVKQLDVCCSGVRLWLCSGFEGETRQTVRSINRFKVKNILG